MQHGICVANLGSYGDPHVTVGLAQAAEANGWDGLFVWDHLGFVWGPPAADPWVTLAAVASATERIRIGTIVTPVARRRPHVLAQTVATLDVLSGGRVTFGAGLGGSESEFRKFGEPADPRVRAEMLDEGLEILRAFWSGNEVTHRGMHYAVDGVTLAPRPVQERVPIWIGGNHERSLRRAVRWDGWCPNATDPSGDRLVPKDLERRLAGITPGNEFDVAVLGESDSDVPADYERAGATWWLDNVHDRRGPVDAMHALVERGPPL
jgi:probable F420-dependent oxidoreductase